ncbi:AlpA family phage regulatory protein [Geomonas sp. RF6]|uniref:helix-turn-helix transcriptional regulator n=1 Tax=Geomonas sp. RF6 TaxID=2897342 RepID=UPI001E60C919|nr:AlpA family phage regulatory protein [Geomonas sp. RF6]UFS72642.1 AlpA family phage regulatory protein [Geomonas sp. RF6]
MSERLLRLREVLSLVPVSKSTWWAGIPEVFPPGRKLTKRTTVWLESEIHAVINGTWRKE